MTQETTSKPEREVKNVFVPEYPYGLSDEHVEVLVGPELEEDLYIEIKRNIVPIVRRLRALVDRYPELSPVALVVIDGRRQLNLVSSQKDGLEGYGRVFSYTFTPLGFGLGENIQASRG